MKRGNGTLCVFMVSLILGVLSMGTIGVQRGTSLAAFVENKSSHDSLNRPDNIPDLVEKVKTAVVNVSTTTIVKFKRPSYRSPFGRDPFEDFFKDFFGKMPREQKRRSLGSGFLVSADGYILTNNHVVRRADEITVRLDNEKEYKAEVVGTDPKTDIALIKIKAGKNLPYVKLGDSGNLKVGEWVIAIGNPFGLSQTVTAGIVSAKGRVIGSGPYDDFIQTDASINPGNSGGPLFDLNGEVVGINTAIVQGGQGIGFAIPVNIAKDVFSQLKVKGKVVRGWLGVYIQKITPDMADSMGLKGTNGVIVTQVMDNSPAMKGGITQGDVVVEFDGHKVRDAHELPALVAAIHPGKKVKIKVIRGSKEKYLTVKIGKLTEEIASGKESGIGGELGIAVQDISEEVARHLKIDDREGVIVTGVRAGSPADKGGIREQDIIRQVNREGVKDLKEFTRALKKLKKEKSILFLVERGNMRMYVVLKKK